MTEVKAGIQMLSQKIDVPDKKVCEDENSGLSCPLSKGMVYTYTKTVELKGIQKYSYVSNLKIYYTLIIN